MPDEEEHDDALHHNIHPMLWKIAATQAVGELAGTVLRMRESSTEDRSAVNSAMMIEVAAEHRLPAEIAELVAAFDEKKAAEDLARLALDAAAARRTTLTLAALVRELVTCGLPESADILLASVVRRRLPRDIAGLLTALENEGEHDSAAKLVDELRHDDSRVLVVLWLRALGRLDLAVRLSARMAVILSPADLAGFITGLSDYRDTASAAAAAKRTLTQDLGRIAEVIAHLHLKAAGRGLESDGQAGTLVQKARESLTPDDMCVLASLLSTGSWKQGAEIIWADIVADMGDAELVDNLSKSMRRSGNPAGVLDAIRKAAETHPAGRVAVLAVEVEGKIEVEVDGKRKSGYETVLDTVATSRSGADVFLMAGELDNRGYSRVTVDLLSRVEQVVHERTDGADIAEFIDRMLTRGGEPKSHTRPFRRPERGGTPAIVKNVARRRDPEQLMGVIAELTKRRRYDGCRAWVERSVAEHYGGALLAALPLVRRRDYLPAVLGIIMAAFVTPKWTRPGEFPAIVLALKEAGASPKDLQSLLTFIGGKRVDSDEIVGALRREKLDQEADWVLYGKRHPPREPHF